MTHDGAGASTRSAGLWLAVLSAGSFGLSGSLASGLMDAGWSAGGAVVARVGIAALVLLAPAWLALEGRWGLLRAQLPLVASYGAVAVAGAQLAYFNAVRHMDVGVALLIEYTAPVAVVAWMWLRHGHRPGGLTLLGAVLAAAGLVLVLDLVSGADLSLVGVTWAMVAMVGAAVYFVISARDSALPPIVLASAGLSLATVALLLAGLVGVVPVEASTAAVSYDGARVPYWLPVTALGVVTAAIAYVSGIAASRRLGPRLASFVGLLEVLAGLLFAWALLGQLPGWVQALGGMLVMAGVVVVKAGDDAPIAGVEPLPVPTGRPGA
ncbi:MAG TPA: DMT family transporter [Marmoricola sp.]|nr:DMT family transporter [Marmoricola sp.]